MRLYQLIGREVLDLSTATTAGHVDDVALDVPHRRILGFRVGSAGWLPFERLHALGVDALTIDDVAQLVEAPDAWGDGVVAFGSIGARVLTDQGRELGRLDDIEVDTDGRIVAVIADTGAIDAGDLIGLGSFAAIVADPIDPSTAATG